MTSTSNSQKAKSSKVRLGVGTWAAIRRCFETDPAISAYDATALICKKEGINDIPSEETVRSRVRRKGWKKHTSQSYSQSLAALHTSILEPAPGVHDPTIIQNLPSEDVEELRDAVRARHRRDLKTLNEHLDVGMAIVAEGAGIIGGERALGANLELVKLGCVLVRAASEAINGKALLIKAEREIYELNKEEAPILSMDQERIERLDKIYEEGIKKAQDDKLLMIDRRKKLLAKSL